MSGPLLARSRFRHAPLSVRRSHNLMDWSLLFEQQYRSSLLSKLVIPEECPANMPTHFSSALLSQTRTKWSSDPDRNTFPLPSLRKVTALTSSSCPSKRIVLSATKSHKYTPPSLEPPITSVLCGENRREKRPNLPRVLWRTWNAWCVSTAPVELTNWILSDQVQYASHFLSAE